MPNNRFINILYLPPPDCARCGRVMVFMSTPAQFRPAGAITYSGVRTLCRGCTWAIRDNPAEKSKYPTLTEQFGSRGGRIVGPPIPGKHFVSIVNQPPPDCACCGRSTYWPRTPARFRPEGSRIYSCARGLCNVCYRTMAAEDPESLLDYPTRKRRSVDTYREYLEFKERYPRWSNREIATELIGISLSALDQAICRARRLERGEKADQPSTRERKAA